VYCFILTAESQSSSKSIHFLGTHGILFQTSVSHFVIILIKERTVFSEYSYVNICITVGIMLSIDMGSICTMQHTSGKHAESSEWQY